MPCDDPMTGRQIIAYANCSTTTTGSAVFIVETGFSTSAPNRRRKPAPRRAGKTWRADWDMGVGFREIGWD